MCWSWWLLSFGNNEKTSKRKTAAFRSSRNSGDFCLQGSVRLFGELGDEHLVDLVALEDELLFYEVGAEPVGGADVQAEQLLIQRFDGAADGAVPIRLFGDAGRILRSLRAQVWLRSTAATARSRTLRGRS